MGYIQEAFKDALPIIQKFAPSLGKIFGGVPGFAIANALPLLANAFNANPADINDVAGRIVADPSAGDKLSNLDNLFTEVLKEGQDGRLLSAEVTIKLQWEPTLAQNS